MLVGQRAKGLGRHRPIGDLHGQLAASGGPFLFGDFCIADAFYAPVCWRIRGYALPVPAALQAYIERVLALPAMQEWTQAALAEHDFLLEDEPYRTKPDW